MLSDRAFMALRDLDDGARLNSVHSVARELIAAGLCLDEWGYLQLTELGRKAARVKAVRVHRIEDENIADLSYRIDPMANPEAARAQMTTPPHVEPEPVTIAPPPAPIEPAADDHIRGLRAAGVATGLTGIEVEARWVREFVVAYVNLGWRAP